MPFAPRPPSTTPVTSGSANGCTTCPHLREVGFSANRRLLDVQRISRDPAAGEDTFDPVSRPSSSTANAVPALRFGDPRVQALLSAPWSSSASYPTGSPTGTCEHTSPHCSDSTPAP